MNIFSFIKDNLPIVNVIQDYTTLKPAGIYWKGLCPFHSEKTSSFTVSPHKDIFYCFGCHAGGDAVAFIARIENCTQLEAAKFLIEKYHLKVPQEIMHQTEVSEKNLAYKNNYYKICELVATWCHDNLKKSSECLAYLSKRKFTKDSIERFNIGYFPDRASIKQLIKYVAKHNLLIQDLIDAQIIVEQKNDFYSGFEERIIFPIKTINGDFCGFGGRIFKEHDDRVKYYNSKENPFFNKGSLLYCFDQAKKSMQKSNTAFIVEGYIDCIAMIQRGITNTVASLGTACTAEHLKLIARFAEKIYVVYDGDDAGQKAVLRLTELAWNANLDIRVITLPKNEDPASYLQDHENLSALLKSDQTIYNFFIRSTKKDFSSQALSEKLNAVKKLTSIVNKIEDPIKQGILLQEISKEFGIPLHAIKKDITQKQAVYDHDQIPERKIENISDLEMQIIGAVLNDHKILYTKFNFIKEFLSAEVQDILKKIKMENDFTRSIEDLTTEQQHIALKSYMYFKEKQLSPESLIEQFQKANWKRIVGLMKEKIAQAEKAKDLSGLDTLLKQFKGLKEKFISGGIDG